MQHATDRPVPEIQRRPISNTKSCYRRNKYEKLQEEAKGGSDSHDINSVTSTREECGSDDCETGQNRRKARQCELLESIQGSGKDSGQPKKNHGWKNDVNQTLGQCNRATGESGKKQWQPVTGGEHSADDQPRENHKHETSDRVEGIRHTGAVPSRLLLQKNRNEDRGQRPENQDDIYDIGDEEGAEVSVHGRGHAKTRSQRGFAKVAKSSDD